MSKFDTQSFADEIGKATQKAASAIGKTKVTGPSDEIAALQAIATLNATNALAAALPLLEGIADAIRSTAGATQADYALTPGAQTEAAPDPAAPDFEDLVTDTAHAFWKADPGNRTAARTFDEDYAASQDRYTEMARRFLDPTEDGTR